jgi:YidC/Oxa1 family membrane protein insertase
MWDLILNPFITVLTLLYNFFDSAVIAIVLFTVLIRLLTLPLTAQQMRSSKKMTELQPELRKLQEKYKNDREKLAQEQMRMYREAGVNPLGGCLPILIQLPIWIGLYQAINHALAATPLQLIDLSGRFLVGGLDQLVPLNNVWLGMDLTQPPTANPLYALVFPAIVLVTSYFQSKMITPAQPMTDPDGKPNQAAAMTQSMTTIMPLMMGFFSLSFSVGLSIYFIVSNVLSIIQYSRNPGFKWRNLLPWSSPTEQVKIKPVVGPSGKSTLKAKLDAERANAAVGFTTVSSKAEVIDEPEPAPRPTEKGEPPKPRGGQKVKTKAKVTK